MNLEVPNIVANFIGGEFNLPRSGAYLDRKNPSTGMSVGKTPDSDAVDTVMAVKAAHGASEKWSQVSVAERAQILNRVADLIEKHAQEFAEIEAIDTGKPIQISLRYDVPKAALNFRYFAAKILTEQTSSQESQYSIRQSVGVAGVITSYDMSLVLLSAKLAPCLAMGNTAVCKPAHNSTLSANLLVSVLCEVGVPPGVCNMVYGRGETAGVALVQHPGVPLISFTGATDTGVIVQTKAARNTKKLSLALSAKNPNIVLKDADLKTAVAGSIQSAFSNSGQNAFSGSRLYVQEEIYEKFMTEFRAQVAALKVGDPLLAETAMGPLATESQLLKVEAAVAQALSEKAKVTVGGKRPKMSDELSGGYFYTPTVIEDLDNCSDLWSNEIFGPVVTAQSFKYAHEAVKWANTSTYKLSASIWTSDLARAHKLAREIKAGVVRLNSVGEYDPRIGDDALEFFSELKTISL